jgi:hypothetical protein
LANEQLARALSQSCRPRCDQQPLSLELLSQGDREIGSCASKDESFGARAVARELSAERFEHDGWLVSGEIFLTAS